MNTHTEAIWRGSLRGLLDRWGGFGGLITPVTDIFLPTEPGEPAEWTQRERLYVYEEVFYQ